MARRDRETFLNGKLFVSPVIRAWRRLSLLLLAYQHLDRQGEMLSRSRPRGAASRSKAKGTVAQDDCAHPRVAHVPHSNQWGIFVHCRLCGARLLYKRYPDAPRLKNRPVAARDKREASKKGPQDPPAPPRSAPPQSSRSGGGKTAGSCSLTPAGASEALAVSVGQSIGEALASNIEKSLGAALESGMSAQTQALERALHDQSARIEASNQATVSAIGTLISQAASRPPS